MDGGTVGSVGAGLAVGALLVVYLVVIVGSLVMMVVALVDMARRPEWQWKLAGQEKVLWLLLVILLNVLAIPALIYWFNIRTRLLAVEQSAAAGLYGPGHMTYAGWEPGPVTPYPGAAPAGWHPDPGGQHQFRWWDGSRWTDHTWSAQPADPQAPSPPR